MNHEEIGDKSCNHRGLEKKTYCMDCHMRICNNCQLNSSHKGHKIHLFNLVEKCHEISVKDLKCKIKQREEMRSEFQKDLDCSEKDSLVDIKEFSEKLINKFSNLVKKRVQKLEKRLKRVKSQELASFDLATMKMEKLLSNYEKTDKSDSMITRRGFENFMIKIEDTELWQHISAIHHEVNIEFDPGNVRIPHKIVHFGIIGDQTFSTDEDEDERYFSSDSEHRISIENLRKRKRDSDDDDEDDLDDESSDESDLDVKSSRAKSIKQILQLEKTNGKSKIISNIKNVQPSSTIQFAKQRDSAAKSINVTITPVQKRQSLPNKSPNILNESSKNTAANCSYTTTPVITLPKETNNEQDKRVRRSISFANESNGNGHNTESNGSGHKEVSSSNIEHLNVCDDDVDQYDKLENLVLNELNSSSNFNKPCNDIQQYYELLKEKRIEQLKKSASSSNSERLNSFLPTDNSEEGEKSKSNRNSVLKKRKRDFNLGVTTFGAGHCLICDRNTQYRKSSVLVCCSSCKRYYHKNCYMPKLDYTPESNWKCSLCISPEEFVTQLSKIKIISSNSGIPFNEARICERILLELYALEESKPFHKVENYIAVAKTSYNTISKALGKFITLSTVRLNLSHYNIYVSVADFLSALSSVFLRALEFETEGIIAESSKKLLDKLNELVKVFLPSHTLTLSH